MPEIEYQELKQKVWDVSRLAGGELAKALADKPELLSDMRKLADELQTMIVNDALDVPDVVNYLVDRFADDLDLKLKYQEYIRDGAKVIDHERRISFYRYWAGLQQACSNDRSLVQRARIQSRHR
jgi:hypothetical protein